jgi:hypothetical protein
MSDIVRERSAVLNNFSGGLNNFWDPSAIADTEVPFLQNLEFSPTGALSSRPSIFDTGATFPEASTFFNILGFYVAQNGTRSAIVVSPTKTYIWNLASTWTEIWSHPAADFVQYQDYVIMCRINGAGAYWNANGAPGYNAGTGLWTVTGSNTSTIATMPAGRGIELHQERLFLFGPLDSASQSIMYWSNISGEIDGFPGKDWRWWEPATNLVSVNGGDGQWITGLVAGYNDITIFRNASTFRYTFSELPEEGTIAKVQDGIGAENQYCIARYENSLFVLSADQLYLYNNGNFTSLNDQKVRFEEQAGSGNLKIRYSVSILGSRAIVNYGGSLYVAQLKTGTWSTWKSSTEIGRLVQLPTPANNIGEAKFAYGVSASATAAKWKMYKMLDHVHDDSDPEAIECILRTKIYDFNSPTEWKRMYWWSADVMASNTVIAKAFPVSLSAIQTSWDAMDYSGPGDTEYVDWDKENDTWDNPTATASFASTTVDTGYTYKQRLSLKLDHGLRFRRVYFELYLTSDGTVNTSPAQIFSLTPMIGTKAKTSDRIT